MNTKKLITILEENEPEILLSDIISGVISVKQKKGNVDKNDVYSVVMSLLKSQNYGNGNIDELKNKAKELSNDGNIIKQIKEKLKNY